MTELNYNWIIFYSGLGFVAIELLLGAATGFDLLLIGLSLIIGSMVGFMTHSWETAVAVSIILAVLYIAFGRRFVKNRINVSGGRINIDALIGKEALVTKTILKHQPGQIKVDNELWRAKADKKFSKGETVKIISTEGVTCQVDVK